VFTVCSQEAAFNSISKKLGDSGTRGLSQLAAREFGIINSVARAHWGVENSLHWCLDVVMDEDCARNRMDHGPQNLAVLRHMALNIMRKDPRKASLRGKFKIAAWNNNYLVSLLAQF
jgi:predicted transposase YbfD/YdcC